jgi:dTDP-6-deoxy-L-talose 4-dehydrogenase (NAD+)
MTMHSTQPSVKIAVTGASGFLGRHVVVEARKMHLPLVLTARDVARLPPEIAAGEVVALEMDSVLNDAFERMGEPDAVLHLAWGGLPNYTALRHFEEELPRQYRFLKTLISDGLRRLIVVGTCLEYGLQCGKLSEDTPCFPVTPYGFAKHALRQQLEFLGRSIPFELVWARLFYVFGPGQRSNSLYAQLTEVISRGDASFAMSGGEQIRDYLRANEVANGLLALTLSPHTGVVNICSGRPISVRRVVEKWIADCKSTLSLDLGRHPYPEYEPLAFWGDNAKFNGWMARNEG